MSAVLHVMSFSGALLARGFWLYVWEVVTADGKRVLYVGRTGDSSSPHAQSPFARLTQHLGDNPHANALRRNLKKAKIDADECISFELVAYGPVLEEANDMEEHRPRRDRIATIEKALCDALTHAGYCVINRVGCRFALDEQLWTKVLAVFEQRFEKLKKARAAVAGTQI